MVGEKIRQLRNEKGLSQETLGKVVGVTTSSIGMYETGARNPSYDVLIKIADYLSVSVDYLFGRCQNKNITEQNDDDLSFMDPVIRKWVSNPENYPLIQLTYTTSRLAAGKNK